MLPLGKLVLQQETWRALHDPKELKAGPSVDWPMWPRSWPRTLYENAGLCKVRPYAGLIKSATRLDQGRHHRGRERHRFSPQAARTTTRHPSLTAAKQASPVHGHGAATAERRHTWSALYFSVNFSRPRPAVLTNNPM